MRRLNEVYSAVFVINVNCDNTFCSSRSQTQFFQPFSQMFSNNSKLIVHVGREKTRVVVTPLSSYGSNGSVSDAKSGSRLSTGSSVGSSGGF